jgi:hypothetical protein
MQGVSGLSASMEDYLEIILGLQNSRRVARSKDIAEFLGVQPESTAGEPHRLPPQPGVDGGSLPYDQRLPLDSRPGYELML